MSSMVHKVRRKLARHGIWNTLRQVFLRVLRCALDLRILRGVHLEQPDPAFLGCDPRYSSGFQLTRTLRRFALARGSELSPAFLREALRKGDACYAVCEGTRLVSSGWYSTQPTAIHSPDLVLHFPPGYVYMYKGLTREPYRGQRLYEVGVTRALEHYLAQGARGFVSYVDAANLDSLKACERMGYRVFGSIYVLSLLGRHFVFSSRGCREFGFRLEVLGQRAARGNRPQRLHPSPAHANVPVV
jgi:hypothetical protein